MRGTGRAFERFKLPSFPTSVVSGATDRQVAQWLSDAGRPYRDDLRDTGREGRDHPERMHAASLMYKHFHRLREEGCEMGPLSYSVAISILCGLGALELAERLFSTMQKLNVPQRPAVYNALMSGYGNVGDMTALQKVAAQMRMAGFRPTAHSYAAALQGLARRGETQWAREVVEAMEREGGVLPCLQVYNLLVAACCTAADAQAAASDFSRVGLTPDVKTWNFVLRAHVREAKALREQGEGARGAAMRRVLASAQSVFDGIPREDATAASWNMLMQVRGAAGDFAGVIAAYRGLRRTSLRPNVVTYGALIRGCARAIQDAGAASPEIVGVAEAAFEQAATEGQGGAQYLSLKLAEVYAEAARPDKVEQLRRRLVDAAVTEPPHFGDYAALARRKAAAR